MKIPSVVAALASMAYVAEASSKNFHPIVSKIVRRSQEESGFVLPLEERPVSYRGGRIDCVDNRVTVPDNGEEYECDGIDLLSFISSDELKIPGTQFQFQSSDIWGWTSPEGREITLLTMDTGIVFIDSTDPINPCIIAKSHSARAPSGWGDVKVVGSFAYTIKDKLTRTDPAPAVGMEIYDLTKFAAMDCPASIDDIPMFDADFVTAHHGSCHNVVSSTESNRIYAVGCRDTCDGGLVILDVAANPLKPPMIGCVFQDGYTHDAQCVRYSGPDTRYTGQEICFAFNEDTLTIWDVTEARDPIMISRTFYENQAYSHQGWLNKDMTKIMLDDELDELCNLDLPDLRGECEELVQSGLTGRTTTSTNIFDIVDLQNPRLEFVLDYGTESIDHNLYEWGTIHQRGWSGSGTQERIPDPNLAYMHNYMAGLRVVDISDSDARNWREVKHFKITDVTTHEFVGAWSGYMFPSGHYAVSSIEKGIFFLDTNTAFVDAPPLPVFPPRSAPEEEESESASAVLYVFFFIFLVMAGGIAFLLFKDAKKKKREQAEGQMQQTSL